MRRGSIMFLVITVAMTMGICLVACGSSSSSGAPSGSSAVDASGSNGSASSAAVDENDGDDSASSSDGAISAGSSEKSEKSIGVYINLSSDSILMFDENPASAQLVKDMSEARPPTSCTVLYDQMGSQPSVTVTDPRTIREVYKKLARMHVVGETNLSMTDNYHMVSFVLQDGSTVSYYFEGEGILVRGSKNYEVLDQGALWSYVRHLQEQYLRDQSAGDDWVDIELEDDDELVIQCPTSAPAGEVVKVYVYTVLDAGLRVAVNGDENYGSFVSAQEYEFVMPDTPVTVRVYTVDEGYGS